jgi:hypothetical protein
VSPLVTPCPRLRSKFRKGGPPPSWILHPGPLALTLTAAAVRGGSNRTTSGDLLPAPTLAAAALLQKQRKQQRRSKIRRTQKVVRPDNDSIPDEVTVSSAETKILPSVRGCGGASSVSGDGVPAIRGRNYPQLGDGDNHCVPFTLRGPLIRPRR